MSRFGRQLRLLPALLGQAKQVRHLAMLPPPASTFKFSELDITLAKGDQLKAKPDPDKLVFGHQFSDHMFEADWSLEGGWGRPTISPFHNFDMHPASKVFHYAIELFEGLKAYRGDDGKVRLFRPDMNMDRLRRTAARIVLPDFDPAEMMQCMKKLISIDEAWVPHSTVSTLYIRPSFIGTEPTVGITRSTCAKLFVITGPVGPYYRTGFEPVSLLADPRHVRAWEGGSGAFKMGSNYAPTILVQLEALQQKGCQQVLWLYGPDHQITEVGTMNFFMFWINDNGERELLTPPLESGLILPGVTRKSLLELAHSWGEFKVSEKSFSMKDLVRALDEGRVKEVFGAGTACVVCPVEKIIYEDRALQIPTMSEGGPVFTRLYNELLDIQFGRTPSSWVEVVD